jgi:hypothetical protein
MLSDNTMYRLELANIVHTISAKNCHSSSGILLHPMAIESLWWDLFLFEKQVD